MIYKIKILIFCLVFGLSGLLIPVVYTWITEGSVLSIQSIQIKAGSRAKSEELQLYLREFIKKPLYGVNLKQVQAAAQRHPWVALAKVRRQPPASLEVEIIEREPIALIKRDKLWVVDTQGVAFKTAENEAELALPLLRETAEVAILLAHVQAEEPGGVIVEIKPLGFHQHRVLFVGGLEVVIGDKDGLKQWRKLGRILKSLGNKKHTLAFAYLDTGFKHHPMAVRFKKG